MLHSFARPSAGTITGRTINQILTSGTLPPTDTNRLFATGKYQTVITTLDAGRRKLGLSGDEKYDAEMQERFFREFLIFKAGGGALAAFIFDGKGGVDDAQYAASKEWASIAAPKGLNIKDGRISDGTQGYHETIGQNHANPKSSSKLRSILQEIEQER